MPSRTTYAAIRFGYGFAPFDGAPDGAEDVLARLQGADVAAAGIPIGGLKDVEPDFFQLRDYIRQRRSDREAFQPLVREQTQKLVRRAHSDFASMTARAVTNPSGLRERLFQFWADHFTVARVGQTKFTIAAYWEDAIRPHVTGPFNVLLKAAVLHPMMLSYLNQNGSAGPNSVVGQRRGRGLNENLAREILELHTLGVGAAYTQEDVREFAELLTGLTYRPEDGFRFRRIFSEPGAEVVLGKSYGGGPATLQDILNALDDIAVHPDTARHIARKLAVHFVADEPPQALVDHMAAAFAAHDGDLMAVYAAMLEHPEAWQDFGAKAKWPFDFLVSSLRALNVPVDDIRSANLRELRALLIGPMAAMGQNYQQPAGPDGFAEDFENWISPQGVAARVQWAMHVPRQIAEEPDPRVFVRTTLADAAGEKLIWAAERAESRWDGVGLVLASPDFNRR